ncbi:hypothetical protein PtB15_11B368 [Puccinia triticina]|nr:hypothetical protein PtB15_11B368 [Puccinia triticina]
MATGQAEEIWSDASPRAQTESSTVQIAPELGQIPALSEENMSAKVGKGL